SSGASGVTSCSEIETTLVGVGCTSGGGVLAASSVAGSWGADVTSTVASSATGVLALIWYGFCRIPLTAEARTISERTADIAGVLISSCIRGTPWSGSSLPMTRQTDAFTAGRGSLYAWIRFDRRHSRQGTATSERRVRSG